LLRSGIYALLRFDGAPIDARDAELLGLDVVVNPSPACAWAQGVDTHSPGAVYRADGSGAITILVGEVEEQEALAARLGLRRDVQPALLARAALDTFGSDTPAHLVGEWSLLHWQVGGPLVLMSSAARRDRLLFAVAGARVAVAPDMFRLARLPWIGSALDEAGLLMALGRAELRERRGDRTMLAQVRQVEPGATVTLDRGGSRKAFAPILEAQSKWSGSFDDAVAQSDRLMRRIMCSRMSRSASPAVLLSGGLDSSLLACLAAEECEDRGNLLLLTSAAPPGSGLPDESAFANAVAERLKLKTELVSPAPDLNIYRPSDRIFESAIGPPLANRHCLTECFQAVARQLGATLLVNGTYGEMTVTAPLRLPRRDHWMMRLAKRLRQRKRHPARSHNPFHVRLSSHRLAALPEAVRAAPTPAPAGIDPHSADDLFGYRPGIEKSFALANEFYAGAIRMDYPYRDLRLIRLFASFPADIFNSAAWDRAPARAMLQGRAPDWVRLRTSGLPASPDHLARLRLQAPAACARILAFRRAGVQEWLDLDWLEAALAEMAERGPRSVLEANEVQLTAIAAEFLTWWRSRP